MIDLTEYIVAFRSLFPEFGGLNDSQVESYLIQASVYTNGFYKHGACYYALLYIAGHLAKVDENISNDPNGNVSVGNISSESVGSVSVSYATKKVDNEQNAFLNSTSYGQRALPNLELCKKRKKLPFVAVGN